MCTSSSSAIFVSVTRSDFIWICLIVFVWGGTFPQTEIQTIRVFLYHWVSVGVAFQALSLLQLMATQQLQPDLVTFSSLLQVCQMAEAWQVAFGVFALMRASRVKPGMDTYNLAMRNLGR